VEVNGGNSPHIPPFRDKPLREGYGDHHKLYKAHLPDGKAFTVFFDSGTTNCYAAKSLANKLTIYKSSRPNGMKGIGGIAGPQINHDTVVTAKFDSTKGPTTSFSLSAGVVPDDTFPGDLTIGNSVFHKWRISFDGDVKLRSFDGKPVLVPCDRVPKAYFAKAAAAKEKLDSNIADAIAIQWGKGIPIDDPKIRGFLQLYLTEFPGLLDFSK
jgi:hypothetical protein